MLGVRWTAWRPERRQWSQPQVNCDETLRPGEGTQVENGDGYERQQVMCVGGEAPGWKKDDIHLPSAVTYRFRWRVGKNSNEF